MTWLGKEYISFTIANVLLPILPYSNVVLQNPEIFEQTPIAGIIRKFSLKETFAMLGPNTNGVKEETFSQRLEVFINDSENSIHSLIFSHYEEFIHLVQTLF